MDNSPISPDVDEQGHTTCSLCECPIRLPRGDARDSDITPPGLYVMLDGYYGGFIDNFAEITLLLCECCAEKLVRAVPKLGEVVGLPICSVCGLHSADNLSSGRTENWAKYDEQGNNLSKFIPICSECRS